MAHMFSVDKSSGIVREARQLVSPNCDPRPSGCLPELIVIHGISLPPGQFGGDAIDRFFCNRLTADEHPYFADICNLQVSAHFLIRRDGELVQYVPVTDRAWHAGVSSFAGRDRCNDYSVGIELEGDDETPYTARQYECLVWLIRALRAAWSTLAGAAVVGHCDIAPGRKTDPGPAFEWERLDRMLRAQSG